MLESARLLFAPLSSCSQKLPASFATSRWSVERVEDNSEMWQVRHLETATTLEIATTNRALTHIEYSIVQELVAFIKSENAINSAPDSLFAMHGALLSKNGFGLLVVGPSEAGKSTLTCALWQNGWTIASDDFCFIQGENKVWPAARRVSLRNGSRALLGEEVWQRIQNAPSSAPTSEGWIFHPHEVDEKTGAPKRDAITIDAMLFLGRIDDVATKKAIVQAQRCNPARAAITLLPYCTLLPRDNSETMPNPYRVLDWGAALPKIAPLAARVPLYALERGELAQMVAAVEALTVKSRTN